MVSSANFLSLRAATQDTGNWMDKDSIQATYNKNAVPGDDQMTLVEGSLAVFYLVHSSDSPRFSKQTSTFLGPSTSSEPLRMKSKLMIYQVGSGQSIISTGILARP